MKGKLKDASKVTRQLVRQLVRRDAIGKQKYRATLDRSDLSVEQWIDHAVEEALDFAGYLKALKRELRKREGK